MTQPAKPAVVDRLTGIDNVSDLERMRPNSARELVNIDLTPRGMPKSRGGYTLALAGDAHSLTDWRIDDHVMRMVAVLDDTLIAFDDDAVPTTIRSGMGPYPERVLSYAMLNGDLYWVDGTQFRRIRGTDLADTEGWPDVLGQPRCTAVATGGLTAGTYQVAVTALDEDGRESGSTLAELVDVAEGGGIQLTELPTVVGADALRIYLTGPNGDVLEWHSDVALPASLVLLGAGRKPLKALETQFLIPLPPGHLIAASGARLLMAAENEVYIGEAFRYGLMHPDRAITFPERVTLLQPCGEAGAAGVFVCGSGRTLWWTGFDEASMTRRSVYPFGAVPGSGCTVSGKLLGLDTAEPVALWLATNGQFVAGLPTGQVLPLHEGQCVLPNAERAAALVRQKNGLRQILMALQGQLVVSGENAAASDSVVTEVRRRGVLVP